MQRRMRVRSPRSRSQPMKSPPKTSHWRSDPQTDFSLAKRTMSASSSGAMRGRPGEVRNLELSNLLAISPRYRARMVSGLAT